MKIIDLLNKIANGEEVPKKIKIDHWCYEFEWVEHESNYYDKHEDIDLMSCLSMDKEELNYEVHEIEEEKKITPTDFENLGYALGSIKKYINKGYDKAIEEEKIPEKIKVKDYDKCIHDVTHKEKEFSLDIRELQIRYNDLLDYLKSKGE